MKQLGIFVCVIVLLLGAATSYAQKTKVEHVMEGWEKELKENFEKYNQSRDDDERISIANDISKSVAEVLSQSAYSGFPFEKFKMISIVQNDDKNFSLYTWVLPDLVGTYSFYGYLQTIDKDYKTNVFELSDKSDSLTQVDRKMLAPDDWYGAVYYEIIEKKINGKPMYTLLGWHPENAAINKKVIDVVYFDDMGRLKFGAPIFQLPKQMQRRIVFEYSAQASMSLKYHKVRKFLFFKQSMIVFDHLAPPDLALLNQFQYYGPDFSNDALKFKGGKWVYQSDIDARNFDK